MVWWFDEYLSFFSHLISEKWWLLTVFVVVLLLHWVSCFILSSSAKFTICNYFSFETSIFCQKSRSVHSHYLESRRNDASLHLFYRDTACSILFNWPLFFLFCFFWFCCYSRSVSPLWCLPYILFHISWGEF